MGEYCRHSLCSVPCKYSASPGLHQNHTSDTYGSNTYGSYTVSTVSYTLSHTVSLAPAPDLSLLTLASCPLP